ncbi:ribosomal protein S18-alanine N-acetyltransferase [Hyphococcus luteus]|uniref:[Ribosomal protein bS18]-alanine N-acetyltransferase n=1 Tax=Hyphococcus luteus TaxID=2058213 RepID=A0A2S7K780_9PROT|nr:ribosomal protein S18-alanine N-acetyltransferase [Marinicaulis flavus]PQA88375.1 ribosomal-protein-alanine N-acetyltransferase [Marinicaulis flavus]
MTGWRIWTAIKEDADALAELEALAFGGRSWGADNVKESFVASRVTVLFGGESKSKPQGFAVWRDLGDEAELLTIGVAAAARRKGLGAALLAAVLDAAHGVGANRFFLEVGADNAAARALYARAGFSQVGVRKAYYADGADADVLARDL